MVAEPPPAAHISAAISSHPAGSRKPGMRSGSLIRRRLRVPHPCFLRSASRKRTAFPIPLVPIVRAARPSVSVASRLEPDRSSPERSPAESESSQQPQRRGVAELARCDERRPRPIRRRQQAPHERAADAAPPKLGRDHDPELDLVRVADAVEDAGDAPSDARDERRTVRVVREPFEQPIAGPAGRKAETIPQFLRREAVEELLDVPYALFLLSRHWAPPRRGYHRLRIPTCVPTSPYFSDGGIPGGIPSYREL